VTIAETAGKRLAELVPDIKRTARLMEEISAASNEQSIGAEQIAKGIAQIDTVVQQNASVSEELASTAEELEGQARHLGDTIGFFALEDGDLEKTERSETTEPKAAPARIASREKTAKTVHVTRTTAIVPRNSGDATDAAFEEF
jgi:methyl-accepting chemotaxis protein